MIPPADFNERKTAIELSEFNKAVLRNISNGEDKLQEMCIFLEDNRIKLKAQKIFGNTKNLNNSSTFLRKFQDILKASRIF